MPTPGVLMMRMQRPLLFVPNVKSPDGKGCEVAITVWVPSEPLIGSITEMTPPKGATSGIFEFAPYRTADTVLVKVFPKRVAYPSSLLPTAAKFKHHSVNVPLFPAPLTPKIAPPIPTVTDEEATEPVPPS